MTKKQLLTEFYQLRNDDKKFSDMYGADEFDKWVKDQNIKVIKIQKTAGNLCRYCGKPNGSNNPDVLCPRCRQNFGHSLYSEL